MRPSRRSDRTTLQIDRIGLGRIVGLVLDRSDDRQTVERLLLQRGDLDLLERRLQPTIADNGVGPPHVHRDRSPGPAVWQNLHLLEHPHRHRLPAVAPADQTDHLERARQRLLEDPRITPTLAAEGLIVALGQVEDGARIIQQRLKDIDHTSALPVVQSPADLRRRHLLHHKPCCFLHEIPPEPPPDLPGDLYSIKKSRKRQSHLPDLNPRHMPRFSDRFTPHKNQFIARRHEFLLF